MKINVAGKDGKTYKVELDKDRGALLFGKKIGDDFEGDLIGIPGYVLEVKGGSDSSGFPMRRDVPGGAKKSVLIGSGTGIRKAKHGMRRRKTVRGNLISDEITQINTAVKKEGAQSLPELLGGKEEKEEKTDAA